MNSNHVGDQTRNYQCLLKGAPSLDEKQSRTSIQDRGSSLPLLELTGEVTGGLPENSSGRRVFGFFCSYSSHPDVIWGPFQLHSSKVRFKFCQHVRWGFFPEYLGMVFNLGFWNNFRIPACFCNTNNVSILCKKMMVSYMSIFEFLLLNMAHQNMLSTFGLENIP